MSLSDTTPVSLTASQVEQGAALLVRAFQRDPVMNFLFIDNARTLDKQARFYQAAIQMGLLYGKVHTTPTMDGVAVWVSPGNTDFTVGQLLKSGFLTAILSTGLRSMRRFMRVASYVEEVKKQTISPRPYWHLIYIGVEPSQQGKGLGGNLIHPILARADAERVPCYLESANERNLTFYNRHGFKVAAHGHILKDGPQIWVMIREPA